MTTEEIKIVICKESYKGTARTRSMFIKGRSYRAVFGKLFNGNKYYTVYYNKKHAEYFGYSGFNHHFNILV